MKKGRFAGFKHSPATIEKLRLAHLGKRQTAEHIAKRLASYRKTERYKAHICNFCGKEFRNHNKLTKYCCRKCFTDSKRLELTNECKECGRVFKQRTATGRISHRQFCNKSCAMRYWGKRRKQAVRTESWRRKISESNKRRAVAGKHNWWNGGVTLINKAIRKSVDFKLWREAVFRRDNWTCQSCGKRGVEIHPHHIKPFSTHPDLRFDINNGQTLCRACHIKTDSWAKNKKFLALN